MRRWNLEKSCKLHVSLTTYKISDNLSEQDIIELHEKFLTAGLQYIEVKDVRAGRILLKNFLDSLNCYHNIACMSIAEQPLDSSVHDIYQQILTQCSSKQEGAHYLYTLLTEDFNYDFLWIEMTEHATEAPWFLEFEDQLSEHHLDQRIPIIVVSYEE